MAGYWVLPPRNKWVLLTLFFGGYTAFGWMTYELSCQRNLDVSYLADLGFDLFKPQTSRQIQEWHHYDPKLKRKVQLVDLAIVVVCALLTPAFLSWQSQPAGTPQKQIDQENFAGIVFGLLVLTFFVVLRLINPKPLPWSPPTPAFQ